MTDPVCAPLPVPALTLRRLRVDDEAEIVAAQAELAEDDFEFVLRSPQDSWADYLHSVAQESLGIDLCSHRVKSDLLVAEVDGVIVGRVSIRHELNPFLLAYAGHIGFGVRPAHRRRGYATEVLRQSLLETDGLGIAYVLITCDDDNLPSARVIEAAGGVLEDVRELRDQKPKRRYWIDRSGQVESTRSRARAMGTPGR